MEPNSEGSNENELVAMGIFACIIVAAEGKSYFLLAHSPLPK